VLTYPRYDDELYPPANPTSTAQISSTPGASEEASSGRTPNVGVIAGGTVGGVAFVVCLFVAICFFFQRRRRQRREEVLATGEAPGTMANAYVEPFVPNPTWGNVPSQAKKLEPAPLADLSRGRVSSAMTGTKSTSQPVHSTTFLLR